MWRLRPSFRRDQSDAFAGVLRAQTSHMPHPSASDIDGGRKGKGVGGPGGLRRLKSSGQPTDRHQRYFEAATPDIT